MAEIRQIQVDGVNYDLVISEDEVSATAAAQSAAQALAYKNQAQTSAAQAQTQATNASNQANRAEDAASRAEAIVGGEFLSYGEDQGLDFDQQDQARENIGKATFKSASGSLVNIEHAANVPLRALTANIVPVQAGSEDPSPSNVRAISGWTGAKVFTGGNTAICTDTTLVELPVPIQPGQTYGFYLPVYPSAATSEQARYISLYGPDREYLEWWTAGPNEITKVSSFSVPVTYVGFRLESNPDVPRVAAIRNISAGQSYDITTYDVTFPSSAGTVYGGSLNVKTGVLTVTMKQVSVSDCTWYYNASSNCFYTPISDKKVVTNQENLKGLLSFVAGPVFKSATSNMAVADDNTAYAQGNINLFVAYRTAGTDVSAFISAFGTQQIVYELATPLTYQCTPTEVTALLGLNNIWADTGDVSLEYLEQGVLTEEYAKYEEERIPLVTAKLFTNPNFADNSWLTINQKGQSVYTAASGVIEYLADRWWIYNSTSATLNSDGSWTIRATGSQSNTGMSQRYLLETAKDWIGKVMTCSVLFSDGTISHVTEKWPESGSVVVIDGRLRAQFYTGNPYPLLGINTIVGLTEVSIKAVKLEKGNVSTLANDISPDYRTELMKCRYYFRRISNPAGSAQWCLTGINATTSVGIFILDNPMRNASKQVSYSGSVQINGVNATSMQAYTRVHETTLNIATAGGLTQYGSAGLILGAGAYIDINANL